MPRSLDEPAGDEGGGAEKFEDFVEDPAAEDEYEGVLEGMETAQLRDLAESLAGRDRAIVFSHYGLGCVPKTLREIAEGLGLSVERVRQLGSARWDGCERQLWHSQRLRPARTTSDEGGALRRRWVELL